MRNIFTTIFILTSVFVLFFAVQVNAQAVEGCAWSFMKDENYCSDESGGNIPTTDESCAGDPPSDESACCCTAAGWLKINSQYDNNGNKIGTINNEPEKPREIIMPNLSVSIPGLTKFSKVSCDEKNPDCAIPWIAEYIGAIFEYSMLAIAILAVIVMMIGGVIWLTAGANSSRISQAKDFIKNGLLGTVLALCSYMALFLINPDLTILPPINISYIRYEDYDPETVDPAFDRYEAPKNNKKYPNVDKKNPKCDDCVVTTLTTKNNKNINKDLNALLLKVRSTVGWRVTEAFPPSSPHQSNCHYNGNCVDVGIWPGAKTCANWITLMADFRKAGLNVYNETKCGPDNHNTKYGTGPHMHVSH